jgi:hypothetical protein
MPGKTFTTLTCPNCGGKRSISSDSTKVKCEYCGNEFLVDPETKESLLESYVACPKCHRNDRVEKITAILASQVHQIQGTTIQKQTFRQGRLEITRDVHVPYTATQSTALAEKFREPHMREVPPEPTEPKSFNLKSYIESGRRMKFIGAVLFGFLVTLAIIIAFANSTDDPAYSPFVNFMTTLTLCIPTAAIFSVPIWFIGFRRVKNAGNDKLIMRLEKESQQRHKDYADAIYDRDNIVKQNVRAIENWQNLYYCYRDDCCFVPNSGQWTTVSEIQDYIFTA